LNDEIADGVCGYEGVLKQQLALISALTEVKIPFLVTLLLTRSSLVQRQEALEFIRDCCSAGYAVAETHFIDAMGKGFRLSHVGKHTRPLTPWQSVEEFLSRVQFNSCLAGRLEISSDGMLRSCAGNHRVYGNIAAEGLHKALSETPLYDLWEL